MPLYRIESEDKVVQLTLHNFLKERSLQRLVEKNLETLMGIRFVASEFSIEGHQRGRIDTLGIDQDGTPVIIEFKKSKNQNVINQGLFYLDWLMDHKGDFTLAVQKVLGSVEINWQNPRLILIAEDFSQYDKHAVNRIGSNIELWVYRLYGDSFLYLEPLYTSSTLRTTTQPPEVFEDQIQVEEKIYTVEKHLEGKPQEIIDLFMELREFILNLGEDIIEKPLRRYVTYKHGKNFAEIWIQTNKLKIWLDISPEDLSDPLHLARDVRNVGHWGTGEVEINLGSKEQFNAVTDLIEQSYRQTL